MDGARRATLAIGGLPIRLASDTPVPPWTPDAIHREFLSDPDTAPGLTLSLRYGSLPPLGWSRLRYRGNYLWAIREIPDGFLLAVKGPSRRATPARVARLDRRWGAGDLFVRVDAVHSGLGRDPLEFPLEVVLLVGALAHRGGIVVHAAGAIRNGRGFVFAGRSGAGKTTIARLLREAGFDIVGDERVILRLDGDRVRLHGTPWPGDLGVVSARSAPVAALFTLDQARATRATPLSAAGVSRAILPRCRLPVWDRDGMALLLDTIAEIGARLPCYRLAFVPDASLVDLVSRFAA
ncbi:MAG TPA: hypothetical protein VGW35_02560 [Methylomirabilota bacterium]|nr:hypothetical protein [Methylomirabilota bacterium]